MTVNNVTLANGNQAIARAAIAAGLDLFSHYPGSPVNGIEPSLKQLNNTYNSEIVFNDSINEHVAALVAMGASFAGARSMVVMKHVGLNIAADPLNYAGYSGVKGGMVVVVGTDPGANSSTGEEDVHWYAKQFNFPLFEPTNIQEIYDTTILAFELSEKYQIPVMIFVSGLICHNTASLEFNVPQKEKKNFYFHKNRENYINVGQRAVENHRKLIAKIEKFSLQECHCQTYFNSSASIVILTRGNTFSHAFESIELLGIQSDVKLIQCNGVYPIPLNFFKTELSKTSEIIVIEDQDGFLENQIKMELFNEISSPIYGKNLFPAYGEITMEIVYKTLAEKFKMKTEFEVVTTTSVPERLGTFCEGCPHTASFFAIEKAIPSEHRIIGGDIGCSSLPPFKADWLLCMNAGIGISQGLSYFVKDQTLVSTGGDGSFFHGGFLSLLNAVNNGTNLVHVVFDNRTIAMTGHQKSASTTVNYHNLMKSIGVDSFTEVYAFKPQELELAVSEKTELKGVHVIWVTGSCARIPDLISTERRATLYPKIHPESCGSCNLCYESLGCPAIEVNASNQFEIDLTRCMRCGVCHEICPNEAIKIYPVTP